MATYVPPTTGEVEQTIRKSRAFYYRPELDILRFLAFLAIFCHHTIDIQGLHLHQALFAKFALSAAEGLSFSVSLFFFLSAYLITNLLMVERQSTGTIHIPSFYIRRILRIWPLYFAFFALCVILGFAHVIDKIPSTSFGAFAVFCGNWLLSFRGFKAGGMLAILWSVCIEEQFYAICPITLKTFQLKGLAILSAALIIISYLVLIYFGLQGETSDVSVRLNSLVQMQYFAAGTLIALFVGTKTVRTPALTRLALIMIGLISWTLADLLFDQMHFRTVVLAQFFKFLLGMIGCICLFFSILSIPKRFCPQFAIKLGRVTYGLYVLHPLCLYLVWKIYHKRFGLHPSVAAYGAMILLSFALVVVIAILSYRYLESPFLRLKDRFSFVKNRPV